MTILIIFGLFLFVLNLKYMPSFSIFDDMFLHTLACQLDLFNVIMVENLTTLKTATFFSLKVFFFVFPVLIPPLKTVKLNVLFAPLMIFFAPCYYKLLCPLGFGPKPFALPHYF